MDKFEVRYWSTVILYNLEIDIECNEINTFKYNKIDLDQTKYLSLKLWGSSLLLKKRNLFL